MTTDHAAMTDTGLQSTHLGVLGQSLSNHLNFEAREGILEELES